MRKPFAIRPSGWALLLGEMGKLVGLCLDTPNNVAAAFLLLPEAKWVRGVTQDGHRTDYERRFAGLDLNYHHQYVKEVK